MRPRTCGPSASRMSPPTMELGRNSRCTQRTLTRIIFPISKPTLRISREKPTLWELKSSPHSSWSTGPPSLPCPSNTWRAVRDEKPLKWPTGRLGSNPRHHRTGSSKPPLHSKVLLTRRYPWVCLGSLEKYVTTMASSSRFFRVSGMPLFRKHQNWVQSGQTGFTGPRRG